MRGAHAQRVRDSVQRPALREPVRSTTAASRTQHDRSEYEAGDVIVREGGHTETLFVILEGAAKVIRKGRTIARLGPGEFFGEISLIDGRPRVATVVADSPLRCLVLEHDGLRKLLLDDPQMAWSLLQTLASRLRNTV
jgi:CRP/FNR family cyclic AMP-dependent transcriptional regulator